MLFPYLRRQGELEPNPYLTTWEQGLAEDLFAVGTTTESFPGALSSVPFTWHYLHEAIPMELVGGFIGISQGGDFGLGPELGWAVRESTT